MLRRTYIVEQFIKCLTTQNTAPITIKSPGTASFHEFVGVAVENAETTLIGKPNLDITWVPKNTSSMGVTPDAIRQLLDELEVNRLTTWATLRRLRKFLEANGARISVPETR